MAISRKTVLAIVSHLENKVRDKLYGIHKGVSELPILVESRANSSGGVLSISDKDTGDEIINVIVITDKRPRTPDSGSVYSVILSSTDPVPGKVIMAATSLSQDDGVYIISIGDTSTSAITRTLNFYSETFDNLIYKMFNDISAYNERKR